MTTLRVQVTLENNNALLRDAAVNTWHFLSTAADRLDDAEEAVDRLKGFYGTLDGLMSSCLSGTMQYKVYDLVDAIPRVPILLDTGTITPAVGNKLPNEVAICLSYRGFQTSGSFVGRTRGRIYLGPWDVAAGDDGTSDSIVDSATVGLIAGTAQSLQELNIGTTCKWAVFSPTNAGAEPWSAGDLLGATIETVKGHVDNAWDTVRSRGVAATARTEWPAV